MNCLFFELTLMLYMKVKDFLHHNFNMKDMGKCNIILDIKVIRNDDCIILFHTYYVEKILKRFEHFNYPSISIVYDSKIYLIKNHDDVFCKKNIINHW